VNQCSILYVKPGPRDEVHAKALRALGFAVDLAEDLPPADKLTAYHAVIVRVNGPRSLPTLGARLRAVPRFGRRVLIALLNDTLTEGQTREAAMCGFDGALAVTCSPRDLAATILRGLRPYPEYRCLLRNPSGRRKAA